MRRRSISKAMLFAAMKMYAMTIDFTIMFPFASQSFQWMSRVLQAVDSIHQVGIYCLALVQPNYLPKTPLGGIHLSECKRRFMEGTLHPANVLLCPHTCVTNLPKPREIHSGWSRCFTSQCYILSFLWLWKLFAFKMRICDLLNKALVSSLLNDL